MIDWILIHENVTDEDLQYYPQVYSLNQVIIENNQFDPLWLYSLHKRKSSLHK